MIRTGLRASEVGTRLSKLLVGCRAGREDGLEDWGRGVAML